MPQLSARPLGSHEEGAMIKDDSTVTHDNMYIDNAFQRVTYGGFWRRLGANLIDAIIISPFGLIALLFMLNANIWGAIIMQFIGGIGFLIYTTSFHALYGATLGKMATGLQIRRLNISAIGWLDAIKRNAVDYVFTIINLIGSISVLLLIPIEELSQASFLALGQLKETYQSPVYSYIQSLFTIWLWSEVIVLLFNKKRRAIHDYIAGTVIVVKGSLKETIRDVAA